MADEQDKVTLARFVRNTVFLIVGVGLLITLAAKSFTTVNADENVVCQSFWTGKLTVWFAPGPHFQFCDSIVRYKKSEQYSFSAAKDQGKSKDESIRARFNDGGFGNISGTLRFELPSDERLMLELHTKFHSQLAIDQQLIRPSVERAVYMSGPLMSSKESASEKRSDLF